MLKLMSVPPCTPPLSVKEAAKALDRSETWVRDHLATGLLERDTMTVGRIMISATSVAWAKSLACARKKPRLRLVVDNTQGRRN